MTGGGFQNRPGGGGGAGTPGAPGSKWRTGSGVPANSLGVDTDQYLNTATGDVYTRSSGTYSVTGNIRGTAGAVGLNNRGAWTAATAYAVNDAVTAQGGYYRAATAFTSGASFTPANWTVVTPPPGLWPTPLTGGTPNRLVSLNADGVTCSDLHPSFLDELGFSQILWLDHLGQYWQSGSVINTDPAAPALTPRYIRAMQAQTAPGTINWRDLDPRAGKPADLTETANQNYVEFGKILNASQWRYVGPVVDGAALNPQARFDGLLVANYPRNAAVPTGRFRIDRFGAGFPSSTVYTGPVSSTLPYGAGLSFAADGNTGRRYASDETTGSVADLQELYLLKTGGPTANYGVFLRMTGAAGSETGLIVLVDEANHLLKLLKVIAGTYTTVDSVASPVAHGTAYYWRFEAFGTWLAVKIWDTGSAEPTGWTYSTYQNLVLGAGYSGVYSNYPSVDVLLESVVVNRGAQAALTGAT